MDKVVRRQRRRRRSRVRGRRRGVSAAACDHVHRRTRQPYASPSLAAVSAHRQTATLKPIYSDTTQHVQLSAVVSL